MKKKSDQTGEVLIWLLRLVLISILAIGIRTFLSTNSQYYESENDVFLRRILFSSESFMKYDSNLKNQYFYIVDLDEILYKDYIEESLNLLFSSKDEIGILVEIDCDGQKDSKKAYYNEEFYRTRRVFTSNFHRNEYNIPILCQTLKNDYYYFTQGVMNIDIVSKFRFGQFLTTTNK